jgi:hypothetical protein
MLEITIALMTRKEYYIILALSFADIVTTQILLNAAASCGDNYHLIEFNPFMRYLMSYGVWLWIVVKLLITLGILYAIYKGVVGLFIQRFFVVALAIIVISNIVTIINAYVTGSLGC